MKVNQLDYALPSELIAQHPAEVRSESRLLVMQRTGGTLVDSRFSRVGEFLRPGDCLVLNDTKVLPARFFARRRTGGQLEGLFLREPAGPGVWEVMLKGARKVKTGEVITIQDKQQRDFCGAEVTEKKPEGICLLRIESGAGVEETLDRVGFPPLPPYIHRDHDRATAEQDRRRYQTVYARQAGAVAAPTAGLHFTEDLLRQLKEAGVRCATVTLHVGAGTFKPIAVENVEEHQIHHEWYRLDAENAGVIQAAREEGGRIIAVGTTVTRVLETVANVGWVLNPRATATDTHETRGLRTHPTGAAGAGPAGTHAATASSQGHPHGLEPILRACEGTTDLFITPGYEFRLVDALITNFHLPRSTLLALVAAFAGLENVRAAYRHAIEQRYRFYSYGDAMLII
jgi:S-adenosylmethionine:tRNA ribosyltransferase-isomerase